MLTLHGVNYGTVFNAPGARGFAMEGYPFHRIWRPLGLDWTGSSFIAKTTTLEKRAGNMPLGADGITPRELKPRCIATDFVGGHVINAVGLSGPGAFFLFELGIWQNLTKPFMLSFMSVAPTKNERLAELREYVRLALPYIKGCRAPVAQQLNLACPNAGHKQDEMIDEAGESLELLGPLNCPVVVNLNPAVSLSALKEIAAHPNCSALSPTNTLPWGTDDRIPWKTLFRGDGISPLTRRGFTPGGLSSPLCVPIGIELIRTARDSGVTKPFIGGNGIQDVRTAEQFFDAGASAIALGVIGMLRPWNLQSTIEAANQRR